MTMKVRKVGKISLSFGFSGILLLGSGCSSQPITTGAAAYWEVAHSEEVEARTGLQEEAAEAFYPSAKQFEPTWDLVHDSRESAAHKPTVSKGAEIKPAATPEAAGAQKAGKKH